MRAKPLTTMWLCAALVFSGAAVAQKPKTKTKAPDISIPAFGAIPKGEDIQKPKGDTGIGMELKGSSANATYQVLKVHHGRSFTRSPSGATPVGGAMTEFSLAGHPPSTERFSTVVRVKCPQKANTSIDLVILDARGDTVMSASGEVNFKGVTGDEADYSVEWSPTPWPSGGNFSMLVRIGGQAMGTYPMKFVGPRA